MRNKKALDHQTSHDNITSSSICTNTINFQNYPHTISQPVLNVSYKLPNTTTPFTKKKTKDCINNRRFHEFGSIAHTQKAIKNYCCTGIEDRIDK